MKVIKL